MYSFITYESPPPTFIQVTLSGGVPVFPYNASLINLDVSETRGTGSGQEAAGELVSLKMQNART